MSAGQRLLAISWEMPPLSGPRAVQVSRLLNHLTPLGWESTVVCFGPRSNRYNQDHGLAARLRPHDGVTLVPVPSLEERNMFRALWRVCPPIKLLPDEKWVWIGRASRVAQRLAAASRFDRLVTFAQPWSDHLIGLRVQRSTRLPWLAHFSDPWSDSPHVHAHEWQRRLWRRMEEKVVRNADSLVFVNERLADFVMKKYPAAWRRKAHVVPHGFDCRDRVAPSTPPLDDPRLRLVYTGRFYEGFRTPEPLLHAIAALERRYQPASTLHVTFVGTPVAAHQQLARRLSLSGRVEFVGRMPFEESARLAAGADVLLVIDAPNEENVFLPSKLVEYLPLNKPILGLTPPKGASADLIRTLGYPVVAPDDMSAIESALESLIAAKREQRLGATACHADVAAAYDIRRTAASFAEILQRT